MDFSFFELCIRTNISSPLTSKNANYYEFIVSDRENLAGKKYCYKIIHTIFIVLFEL